MAMLIRTFALWLGEAAFQCLWRYMLRVGLVRCFDLGGDKPDAPDYTPLAQASEEAAKIGAELGRAQLAENKSQFDRNMEVAAPIIQAQKGIMDQTMAQGEDYFNYMKGTFRPIEQGLADEAQNGTNRYNTNVGVRAAVEEEATRAAADVARASANSREQSNRAMIAMGVNPNSGRFAAMKVGSDLAEAGMRAGAQTNARKTGIALDYAKRLDVSGLGRNLPGASQGAYQVATGAGNSAVNNQNQTAAQYINGMGAGTGTIMQGQGLNVQGLGSALNAQTSAYNAALANGGSDIMGSLGGIMGGGAAVGKLFMASDRRLKENIVKVGDDARGFGIYEFNYLNDREHRYQGVMADEVQKVDPEAVMFVMPSGYAAVNYGRLGLQMVEV